MSMTETPTEAPKKRKYKARRKVAARPKPPSELAGLTVTECASACNAERCVISWQNYCAHPYKNGLQGADIGNSAAVERLNAAKKSLGKKKIKLGEHS